MPIAQIQDNDRKERFVATAGQTVFPYDFPIYAATDLQVRRERSGVITTLTYGADYSVTGAQNQTGGNVVLTAGATLNDIIVILSNMSAARTGQFVNGGDLSAAALEAEFNRNRILIQQNYRDGRNALLFPQTDPTMQDLPPIALRANRFLAFDINGQPYAATPAAGTVLDAISRLGDNMSGRFGFQPGSAANPGLTPNNDNFSGLFSPGTGILGVAINGVEASRFIAGGLRTQQAGTGAVARTAEEKLKEIVNIKDYGVIGDGIADDTAALQTAINSLPNGGTLMFGRNRCKITSTLQIGDGSVSAISTKQNLRIVGDGVYGSSNQEISPGFPAPSLLIWAGAAGGTMISINGPMVNSIEGIQLDGADIANVGILDTHSIGGVLDVHVRRVRLSYIQFRAHENTPLCYTSAGAGRVARIRGYDPTFGVTNFRGVDVGNPTYDGNAPGLDVARLELALLEIARPDGATNDCITFRMCDNIRIGKVFLYGSSTTVGNAFAVRVPTGASPVRTYFPTCIGFDDFAYRGGFYFDPTWAPWSSAARGRGFFIKSLQEGDSGELIPTHPAVTGYTYAGLPFGAIAPLSRVASQVQVTGTIADTTVWTYDLPGWIMQLNRRVRLTASGTYLNNTGASRNLKVYADYATQTLFNGHVTLPANALAGAWKFTVDMGPYNAAISQQESISEFAAYTAGTVGGVAGGLVSGAPLSAHNNLLTVDSSIARTMRLIFQNANTGQVLNLDSLVLELV
jgi:hypothetical protein